jgi:hypothetical protein
MYSAADCCMLYNNNSTFPFTLGEDQFIEQIDFAYREASRRKKLPITSLNVISQDQRLLLMGQQLYLATQENEHVKESFAKAIKSSQNREALWEWQVACNAINKTLKEKIRELAQTTPDISTSDLQAIYSLTHFAFQQSKYIVEKHICEQNNREHMHRWFIIHDYKGKL